MSVTNQLSSMIHDDCFVPMDLRYMNFLNALHEIHDETMRNRCHQYWTSLYQYFDHSMTSERALALEEKRTREILHRLDIEMTSRQSEIAYQVHSILQRGHQVLANLHIKYDRKKNSLREIEQNIDELEIQIQNKKSEISIKTVSSSISLYQMTETIDNLKLEIKDLHKTRMLNVKLTLYISIVGEALRTELNTVKANYFSTQIQAYHTQQNIYKTEKELIEIQHELTLNLKSNHEQESQLFQLLQYEQNIFIPIDHEYFNIDYQSIKDEIKNEQKLSLQLKKQNNELNYTILYNTKIRKINENKQIQLNTNDRNLIETIHLKQEEIQKEKEIKREISRNLIQHQTELKRKKHILYIHHRQEDKLKVNVNKLLSVIGGPELVSCPSI